MNSVLLKGPKLAAHSFGPIAWPELFAGFGYAFNQNFVMLFPHETHYSKRTWVNSMKNDEKSPAKPRVKGIYLLPNLFTVAALFAGFYVIVAATKGLFDLAAMAIFVAMLLDALDGRIARLTHSQSEFGAQMDSLSDMVCFGITPALVLYEWSLNYIGKPGWLVAFLYAVCTALRLARFNSQSQQTNKRYFQGLATPAAAGVVASMIWTCTEFQILGEEITILVAVITTILGLLKVSTIRYRSFKDLDVRGKVPFIVILIIVLGLVLVSFDPPAVLLALFAGYVLSGPIGTLWGLRKVRKRKRNPREK